MWSEGAWDEVQLYLPKNGNGSRVVVTTRLSDLAAHLSSSPFKLNILDEDKSWELFTGKAFGEGDCPVELEEIGKKIVRRCRGLPLSIVVIGGHLRKSSRAIEYWEKVANYMNPISSIGEEEQCLDILSLSYQHLPAYLKPCFLYLGIFKEDGVFGASGLLRSWIGEGFLKPKTGLSLEEVGEDCLKDLIDRNLILVYERSWNGKVGYCKIHDTVREVCLKECKKERFMCVVEDTRQVIGSTERRIVIPEGKKLNSVMIGARQSAPLLRSLVHQGGGNDFLNELVDSSLLRVLVHDLDTCFQLAHIQLVNLRTLNVADSTYSILPSISAFWNLQTLCIVSFGQPVTLPYEIWEMLQLRYLQVHSNYLPDPVLNKESSSTQQKFIVLQNLYKLEGALDLRLTEEVCKRMPNLKELWASYHHFYDDCCFQNLGRFSKLKSLVIKFDGDSRWRDAVLSLTFPTSLELLYLKSCHLGWEDLTVKISSLPHLGSLEVNLVRGFEWNLDEEELCCLKSLKITNCDDLIYLNANSSHFPVLEHLVLRDTTKLSEIPFNIGEIPTLRLIELKGCSASAAVSAVRMVVEQEANGNHDIQLHVSFSGSKPEEFERFQEMMQQDCLATSSLHLYYNGKKIKTF